jgi:hypothetical protein
MTTRSTAGRHISRRLLAQQRHAHRRSHLTYDSQVSVCLGTETLTLAQLLGMQEGVVSQLMPGCPMESQPRLNLRDTAIACLEFPCAIHSHISVTLTLHQAIFGESDVSSGAAYTHLPPAHLPRAAQQQTSLSPCKRSRSPSISRVVPLVPPPLHFYSINSTQNKHTRRRKHSHIQNQDALHGPHHPSPLRDRPCGAHRSPGPRRLVRAFQLHDFGLSHQDHR